MSSVIHAQALHKTYAVGADEVSVLRGLSLEVPSGQSVAVLGASGSGKSTLLHMLGGLDQPDTGDVHWLGQPVAAMSSSHWPPLPTISPACSKFTHCSIGSFISR